jgi:DNA-binding response OmpR family regulator
MAREHRVLLVEDDDVLADVLAEQLSLHKEFELQRSETARGALDLVGRDNFDLILMDVGLPDQDGRETCKIMRRDNVTTPIIMLTGAASDADTILGLDAGANDYVTKPFRFGILLARMRAHLRSHENSEAASLRIGPYVFRPAMKLLQRGEEGEKIRLTEKESNILRFLHRAEGAPVARETLLHEVWGYNAQVSTHTLETHIYRLRQKIEADPSAASLLVTVEGGYSLTA